MAVKNKYHPARPAAHLPGDSPLYHSLSSSFPSPPHPVSRASLSRLLYDSLSLSAWKTTGFSTWSLLVNPSSGNLHPTEAHLLSPPLPDSDSPFSSSSFLAHYSPKDHSLELRTRLDLSSLFADYGGSILLLLSPPSSGMRPGSTASLPSVTATTTSTTPLPLSPSPRLPSAGTPASSTASATTTSTSTAPTLHHLPSSPSAPFAVASPGSSPNIRTAPSSFSSSALHPLSITLCSVPPYPVGPDVVLSRLRLD